MVRTAVITILALLICCVPLQAQWQAAKDARIHNENVRHNSVLVEMNYRRADAKRELKRNEDTCAGDQHCLYVQRINYYRTKDEIDAQTAHENAVHEQLLKDIDAAYRREESQ